MISFKDLQLLPAIQQALEDLGFAQPTEIQKRAIPVLLSADKIDILGQAQTGTGKTLAFGIPLLQKINPDKKDVQALIVAPTRELVVQITTSLRQAAQHMPVTIEPIYGGVSMPDQVRALRRGTQIVVGTPGRLNDHLRRKTLSLKNLSVLVLDEADIMLDMGFKEEVDDILRHAPKERQIWLFSATVKPGIDDIMKKHMSDTVSVRVSPKDITTAKTKQYFCVVPQRYRAEALGRFIDNAPEFYGLIFCPTKVMTSEVADRLTRRGYRANALHGDLSQVQRNRIIKKFKDRDFSVLVATDVAARGIDIADLTHVINYSLPDDLESYVHRIGRTGRAGKEGIAITFISPSEKRKIKMLERKFKAEIHPIDVPTAKEIAHVRGNMAADYMKSLVQDKDLPYQDQLREIITSYTDEEVRKAVVALLYDRYLKDLAQEKDIPFVQAAEATVHDELAELFLSVGEDKGITKQDVMRRLLETGKIKKEQIKRIKIMRGHTFAVVPTDLAEGIVEALRLDPHLKGQRLRVSITAEQPSDGDDQGKGRRRSDRGRGQRKGFDRHRKKRRR